MNIGEVFTFKGFDWIVLNMDPLQDTVTAMMAKPYCEEKFDEDGWNNWGKSSLRGKLQRELVPILGEENLVRHETDLVADNGDGQYGTVEDLVWIISCDDFRDYRKAILDNYAFEGSSLWTVTPWWIDDTGDGGYVRYVTPSGNVSSSYALSALGVSPACVFHLASVESAPTGAPEDDLAKLTKDVEDLMRRVEKLKKRLRVPGNVWDTDD